MPTITYTGLEGTYRRATSGTKIALILTPDAETGNVGIDVFSGFFVGAGTPHDVYHFRATSITIPNATSLESAREICEDHEEEILEWAKQYKGTVFDGSNHVGVWDDDDVSSGLEELKHALENVVCWQDTDDWYTDVTSGEILDGIEKTGSVEAWAENEVELATQGHASLLVQAEVEQYAHYIQERVAEAE